MTNEEEKILEEANDITLEDAAEEAKELQEETQDEGRAIEIPIEHGEEIRERPVLRGAADPNMIQKHIDNFLAMLCGETPVDSNVRTSAEYWLKRLATGDGGSTKKIYSHSVNMYRGSNTNINIVVLNTSPTPMNSITEFLTWASSVEGTIIFPTSGVITVDDVTYETVFQIVKFVNPESWAFYHTTTTGFERVNIDSMSTVFLGVNDRVTTIN